MKEVRDFRVGIHLQSFSGKARGVTAGLRKEMWLNTVLEVGRVGVLCCLVEFRIRVSKPCSVQRLYRQVSEASMSFFPLDFLLGLVLRKLRPSEWKCHSSPAYQYHGADLYSAVGSVLI